MPWLILILAGLLEVLWAFCLKQSQGFSKPGLTAITLLSMIASVVLLAQALRSLPLGTGYMVWTGIGAVGAFIVGVTVLGEAVNPIRISAAVLILGGILLMKVGS